METLGKRLALYRDKSKFSIAYVSRMIGVSPSTYGDWEKGRAIQGEPYIKLATLYKVSLLELMTGEKGDIEKLLNRIEISVDEIRRHL